MYTLFFLVLKVTSQLDLMGFLYSTMTSSIYSPLSNSDDQNVELEAESYPLVPAEQWEAPRSSPSREVIPVTASIFYLGLGAIVSIVINLILLYMRVSPTSYRLYSPTPPVSLRDLRHPSQYIGLDHVARSVNNSAAQKKPLRRINYPDVLVQIRARNSDRGHPHIINRTSNFLVSDKVRSDS
jgi:hypothetical protein